MTCQYDLLITTTVLLGQIIMIGEYFGKAGISIREFHTASEDEEKSRLDIFVIRKNSSNPQPML